MIVTIHQPDFLPWLGFFARWRESDLYLILDDVQFLRRGWHHRDKIKTAQGPAWLTVPVKKKGHYGQSIREVEINHEEPWKENHLKTVERAYKKAPNFSQIFPCLERMYAMPQEKLLDFNLPLLKWAAAELHISTPVRFASEFQVQSTATHRLVDLVRAVGGDTYLTGWGSRDYLDETLFAESGIQVIWHRFEHPVYPQLHGDFLPNLSVLDYLMMEKTT